MIKPYTRIQIKFISGELNIESADVESLLVSCILDTTINGRIDQVRNWRVGNTIFRNEKIYYIHLRFFRCPECWSWTSRARAPLATSPSTNGITNLTTYRS